MSGYVWLAVVGATVALDLQNVAARWRRPLEPGEEASTDYTIVIPLYGRPSYFGNRMFFAPFKDRVLVAVPAGDAVVAVYADLLERAGWRVARLDVDRASPPALLRAALDHVSTTYVVRLDGDSEPDQDLGRAVAAAAAGEADLCSVKIVPSRESTLAERLQAVEYGCSMLGRHLRPWLTSGACMIARRDALAAILDRHSGWFAGEDMETGLIAKAARLRIRHVDFAVRTAVPATLWALLRQRAAWSAGSFRITCVNLEYGLLTPVSLLYGVGLVWVLGAGRLATLAGAVSVLPLLIVLYTGVVVVANWRVRSRWMILYVYYSLVQALVLVPLGLAAYARAAWTARDLGRFRLGSRELVRAAFVARR